MDLSTTYLGFKLQNPFIAGAGPISDTLDSAKRAEDAGAAALVMRSLFKEQITGEASEIFKPTKNAKESWPDFLGEKNFILNEEKYLEQLAKIKETVSVPVFASLNGHGTGEWLEMAKTFEQAGADALELNIFFVANDINDTSENIETRAIEMVKWLYNNIKIPFAVKLSPYYTSVVNFARNLKQAGANGLVLFNRSYETDIDVELRRIFPQRQLSDARELLIRLRWLAILSGALDKPSLAVSGGVHSASAAVKAMMCGASAIQMVSALLKHGPEHLNKIREDLERWMERNEVATLSDIHCCMDTIHTRANYMHLLQASNWA